MRLTFLQPPFRSKKNLFAASSPAGSPALSRERPMTLFLDLSSHHPLVCYTGITKTLSALSAGKASGERFIQQD